MPEVIARITLPGLGGLVAAIVLASAIDARGQPTTSTRDRAESSPPAPTPPPPPPPPSEMSLVEPPPPAQAVCLPSCRDGYTCISGSCISACNPPCAGGERCTGRGTCESTGTPSSALGTPAVSLSPGISTPTSINFAPPISGAQSSPDAPLGKPDSHFGFNINLLGLLQLGPTLALEAGGRDASISVRVRAMNAGVLSHFIIADSLEDQVLGFSYGAAIALRFYGGKANMRGFFVSPGVEYAHTRVEEGESVAYNTHALVPELELGYRWVFGSGFLLEVGGGVGYMIVMAKNSERIAGGGEGGTLYENNAENAPYAVGTVAIGTLF